MSDANEDPSGLDFFNRSSDLSVVKPNAFSGLNVIKNFRQSAPDARRTQNLSGAISGCTMSRTTLPLEYQRVSCKQFDVAGLPFEVAYRNGVFASSLLGVLQLERYSRCYVRGLVHLGPATFIGDVDD